MEKLKRLTLTQIKALFYSVIGVISACIAFAIAFHGLHETVFYAICWAILFGGIGVTVCRTALHLYLGEYDADMWSVSISMLAMCGGWLGCILCNTYGWLFFWVAFICFFLISGLGLRFVAQKKEEEVPMNLLEKLSAEARYKFIENDISKGENEDAPLCMNDGKALTVNEAFDAGYGASAANGLEYLKAIVRKVEENNNDMEEKR